VDTRGVERAKFALSAILEGHPRATTADGAAIVAIETWNLLLSAQQGRSLLDEVPAADMQALRDWMVVTIAREAGLPLSEVVAALDLHVGATASTGVRTGN
jgi:site-specific recombinase XerC